MNQPFYQIHNLVSGEKYQVLDAGAASTEADRDAVTLAMKHKTNVRIGLTQAYPLPEPDPQPDSEQHGEIHMEAVREACARQARGIGKQEMNAAAERWWEALDDDDLPDISDLIMLLTPRQLARLANDLVDNASGCEDEMRGTYDRTTKEITDYLCDELGATKAFSLLARTAVNLDRERSGADTCTTGSTHTFTLP